MDAAALRMHYVQMGRIKVGLTELILQGEGQTIEFKKSLSLKREALEDLCAMVNADSAQGVVIFGVEDKGTICGVEPGNLDKAQRSLSQTINDFFDPQLKVELLLEIKNDMHLLSIWAQRDKSIPYYEYDGRAWIRQGSDKRQLTIFEKDQLRKSRDRASHAGPWKCDRCGSWVGQLLSFSMSTEGMKRDYGCDCGGEYWPIE